MSMKRKFQNENSSSDTFAAKRRKLCATIQDNQAMIHVCQGPYENHTFTFEYETMVKEGITFGRSKKNSTITFTDVRFV